MSIKRKTKEKQKQRENKKVKLQFMFILLSKNYCLCMNYEHESLFIGTFIHYFYFYIFFSIPYVCTCMVNADRYYAIWCSYHPEAPEGSNHILIFYVITTVLPQKKSKITHVIILNILISHGKIFSSNLWDILWLTNS